MMKGKIYKIISTGGPEFYVGSTSNTTRDRFKYHNQNFAQLWKGSDDLFCSCFQQFERYGVDHWKMVLIKEDNVHDTKQLKAYKTWWIKTLLGSLIK